MNDTIAIFSSARRHGNTRKLLDCVAGKVDVDIVDLAELNFSGFDYEHSNLNDDFLRFINLLVIRSTKL